MNDVVKVGDIKVVVRTLDELIPYEDNPRNNENAVEFVANSISNFGYKDMIVIDKNNVIVCGHTRYKACKKLGIKEVACILADDLTDDQVKAFRLADNKVAEMAEWDGNLVQKELDDLFGKIDMELFGFFESLEQEEKEEQPEVEFTEVLLENHQYVVLFFDNDVDWLQAQSLLGIHDVKNLSTRQDGKLTKGMERKTVGRVLNGKDVLEALRKHYED